MQLLSWKRLRRSSLTMLIMIALVLGSVAALVAISTQQFPSTQAQGRTIVAGNCAILGEILPNPLKNPGSGFEQFGCPGLVNPSAFVVANTGSSTPSFTLPAPPAGASYALYINSTVISPTGSGTLTVLSSGTAFNFAIAGASEDYFLSYQGLATNTTIPAFSVHWSN